MRMGICTRIVMGQMDGLWSLESGWTETVTAHS